MTQEEKKEVVITIRGTLSVKVSTCVSVCLHVRITQYGCTACVYRFFAMGGLAL